MLTRQDEIIASYLINRYLGHVNNDKRTPITTSEIAQYICEYYPEMFENIASNENVFKHVSEWLEYAKYISLTELAEDMLADERITTYENMLANNFGYSSISELEQDYMVIYDSAIDGYLIF